MADLTGLGEVAGLGQTVLGIGQSLFSGKGRAERNLEKLAGSYKPNQSILDYYNQALAKYNPNAYNSQAYQNRANINQRNLTTGINAAQDRRGGIGALGGLVQGADDANAKAASEAESEQRANLSQLGQATGMKAEEDFKPFSMKYNLLAAKAGGANANLSAGVQNIYGGLSSLGNLGMAKQIYGNGNNRNNGNYNYSNVPI
jgi:hypothetical protein